MVHRGTQRMETSRLILRPFRVEDGHDMFVNWASDPEVTKYLTWKTHESEFDSESFCAARAALSDMPQIYDWIIEYKENHQAIGSITLNSVNEKASSCELGYCLSSKYWNRGIMTEAAGAILDYAFNVLEMYRVFARHDIENTASGRVMEKCGMKYEGILRGSAVRNSGERTDCVMRAVILPDRE